MQIDLDQEKKLLEADIRKLESQIAPLAKELAQKRGLLSNVRALLEAKLGKPSSPQYPDADKKGFWKNLCNEKGWHVGGDSAHRVVLREDPDLHRSIAHKCSYDQRTYP